MRLRLTSLYQLKLALLLKKLVGVFAICSEEGVVTLAPNLYSDVAVCDTTRESVYVNMGDQYSRTWNS